jgi:hypothetical protein
MVEFLYVGAKMKLKNINKRPLTIQSPKWKYLLTVEPNRSVEVDDQVGKQLLDFEARSPGHWEKEEEKNNWLILSLPINNII